MALLKADMSFPSTGREATLHKDILLVRQRRYYFWLKRAIDVLISVVLLVITAPILLLVAICIKLDSPGHIIFVQERVGSRRVFRNGEHRWEIKHFKMYKFRSMTNNADPLAHKQHIRAYISGELDGHHESSKLKGVMSVTRVGRIIRKTSIDELPQLVNVIKGDMSLVGPRPLPTYEVEEYEMRHFARFAALPGITGLWQVSGRCLTNFEEQIQMDVEYGRNQSLYLDFKILFMTIPAVLSGIGAQ